MFTKPSNDLPNYLDLIILEVQKTWIDFSYSRNSKYKNEILQLQKQRNKLQESIETTIGRSRDEQGCYSYKIVA